MQEIVISGKKYYFIKDYKGDKKLREMLNALTSEIWEFTFEKWYQSGFWADSYHIYSLIDENRIVAHITVSEMEFNVLRSLQKYVQLGTVMTKESYRHQGLSDFLMKIVLEDWRGKCDMIFLYANDSVCNFYPKYQFTAVNEYYAIREQKKISKEKIYSVRKIDINKDEDISLLIRISQNSVPAFDISPIRNTGLIMFYCKGLDVYRENIFYITGLDTIVFAEYENNNLIIYDVLSTGTIYWDKIISTLSTPATEMVILYAVPIEKQDFNLKPLQVDNSTLFVESSKSNLFQDHPLTFTRLSQT